MKIICSQTALSKGINSVLKAVSNKSTLTILECILIEANNDTIKLTANDMDFGIETIITGDILEPGTIALDAKLFSEMIRKLSNSNVTIETDEYFQAFILCEKTKLKIAGKKGNDFPKLPEVSKENPITISQFTLKDIINKTIFSISDNENNKLMTGELFEINNNKLRICSLDGHRISIRMVELKENYEKVKVIIPGKTLNDISKIIPGGIEDEVKIYVTNNHILFEFDNTKVVSRLIEGDYFNIDQMLTSDYDSKVTINKRELLDCIDRSSLFVKESDKKPILVELNGSSMELRIDSTIGSMRETIDIEKEGKDILIGFNPRFLMDVLRNIDEEKVDILFVNSKAPCFIKDENSYNYLILPINISSAN